MTDHEQGPPAAGDAALARPGRHGNRRRLALIGAGGAAAILAGGALLASQTRDAHQQSLPERPAVAPQVATASSTPGTASAMASEMAPTAPSAAITGKPPAETSPPSTRVEKRERPAQQAKRPEKISKKVRKEIRAARAKAAADGVPLRRPLEQKTSTGAISQRTEKIADGTIRITTARHDLTGQGPLAIAADEGTKIGDARCTNRIRFSAGAPAQKRSTLLLCWRTSAKRSVVTMIATPGGKPAAATSVGVIDREWAKLG